MAEPNTKPAQGCNCDCEKPKPEFPKQYTGQYILARALRMVGIDTMYGLCGIPVTGFSYLAQREGIKYLGFRFEQQAGMAAQIHGYETGKPGCLLTVSSMGFLNGLTATTNATVNCYPMIQISGSSQREPIDLEQGTYEGLDQLNIAKPLVKAAYRVNKAIDIPTAVVRAYRAAISGRPGGVYLDITTPCMADIVDADVIEPLLHQPPVDPAPAQIPSPESVERAVTLLKGAKKPAIIIGKGAAFARVEDLLKRLVEDCNVPYYPMSMAKGVLPDNHPLSALSCRREIMEESDVVLLAGARLNWLLSRGHGDWEKNPGVKFIQLDIDPEEIDCNVHIDAPVVGDLRSSLTAILDKLGDKPGEKVAMGADPKWVPYLQDITKKKNAEFAKRLEDSVSVHPMNHWSALSAAKKVLEANPDVILVNEGANTLDDCRDTIDMFLPRHRIDCATWAIMGVGMGSAIGAAVSTGKSVAYIGGDSAFGFSGMDFGTVCRFKLPIVVSVFNNGGIYNNVGEAQIKEYPDDPTLPVVAPTTLDLEARYDCMADVFNNGAAKYYVTTPEEYEKALTEALALKAPAIINVQLAGDAGKESGHIAYLNPPTLIPYHA